MREPRRPDHRDQSGAISIMAAVLALAMVMATSLAVDVGRVAYTSRDQQGATDRAVLDALRALPALHVGATGPDDVWDGVEDQVLRSLEGNEERSAVGTSSARAIDLLEVGYVDPASQQFRVMWTAGGPGAHEADWATQTIDTIRLSTHSSVDFVFGVLAPDGARDVYRQAFGTTDRTGTPPTCTPPDPACTPTSLDAETTISVGSRLAEVETNESLLAPVLTALFGAGSTLTLAGFDGLLTADVPLGVLGNAGADVGTVDSLLASTNVNLRNLASVAASGLDSDDAAVAADVTTALAELSTHIDPMLEFDVEDVLDATTEDPEALLTAEVPLLDLLLAGAMAARVADGTNLLSIDLGTGSMLGLAGTEGLTLGVTVIEAPQFAHGRARWLDDEGRWETRADTAQVEVSLDLTLEGGALDSLLDGVTGLVEGVLDSFLGDLVAGLLCPFGVCSEPPPATVRVALTAAEAEADLTSIDCQQPAEESLFTGLVGSQAATVDADLGILDGTTLADARQLIAGEVTVGGVADEQVEVDGVPGYATTSGGSTLGGVPLLDALALDTVLEPVLGLLGIELGTGQMGVHAVRCDVPVLLPNP